MVCVLCFFLNGGEGEGARGEGGRVDGATATDSLTK